MLDSGGRLTSRSQHPTSRAPCSPESGMATRRASRCPLSPPPPPQDTLEYSPEILHSHVPLQVLLQLAAPTCSSSPHVTDGTRLPQETRATSSSPPLLSKYKGYHHHAPPRAAVLWGPKEIHSVREPKTCSWSLCYRVTTCAMPEGIFRRIPSVLLTDTTNEWCPGVVQRRSRPPPSAWGLIKRKTFTASTFYTTLASST